MARTDDALANWYNPAGLVSSEKTALNASSNAYELTKTTLNGVGQKSSSTKFSPIGGFFGIVVGAPSPRTRGLDWASAIPSPSAGRPAAWTALSPYRPERVPRRLAITQR